MDHYLEVEEGSRNHDLDSVVHPLPSFSILYQYWKEIIYG